MWKALAALAGYVLPRVSVNKDLVVYNYNYLQLFELVSI